MSQIQPATVLVVDDVPENVMVLSGMLRGLYRVIFATGGVEALEMVHQQPVALILLDVVMPGIDGYEVCRRLKADPATREIPVIFVTALEDARDEAYGLALGAVDFLQKPSNVAIVQQRVAMHLEHCSQKLALEQLVCERTLELLEKQQIQEALMRAKEAAEAASLAKSAFLSSMSHELRTPLNAIIGFAQMLDMGVPVPLEPSQREAVGHILGSGRHLLALINEVLDLTRIEAGKLDLVIQSMALKPVMDEAMSLTQPIAARRQILLRQSCPADVQIRADPARVRQILLNLLSNAVKYNREGGMVMVTCHSRGAVVRITVVDTGPGIAEERQNQLFQPFQRLGAERTAVEGTGIGLVICRKLAQAMAGQIGFESGEGIGSRFWVDLPVDSGGAVALCAESAGTCEAFVSVHGRVVYVEDNPGNVAVMKHVFLQLPGVVLLTAETAESGLALIQESLPDLVLMDVGLPGMNGVAALKAIKADARTAAIPVVAVSAAALPQDVRNGLEAGFKAYLTKPFEVPVLTAVVRDLLGAASGQHPGMKVSP